jgi:hypothetical protein
MAIGLPERSDKRDAIILSSSLTGFNVQFLDTPTGEQVSKKGTSGVSRLP